VPLAKTAAVDNNPTHSSDRHDERKAGSDAGIWLLVQNALPATAEGSVGDTVLAAFPLSAPDSVEEEVAKEYKLELVDRQTLPSLGLRIARYRVPDLRSLATVVDRLRADERVNSAQATVQYRRLDPSVPETEVSGLKKLPGVREADDKRSPSVASQSVAKTTPSKTVGRRATITEHRPAPSTTVGDVLAGGF
jgi:hypothetical protein